MIRISTHSTAPAAGLPGRVPLEATRAYWQRHLAGAPPAPTLPLARARTGAYHLAHLSWSLPPDLGAALADLGRQADTPVFTVVLAALQVLIARYTRQTDLVMGTVLPASAPATPLPIRLDLAGRPTFHTILAQALRVVREAEAHATVPFAQALADLEGSGVGSSVPLFSTMLVAGAARPDDQEPCDLVLMIDPAAPDLAGLLEYNAARFDAAAMERFLGHFATLLASAAATPDTSIWHLDLLPAAEHRQITVDWNATETVYPDDQRLEALFAAQVVRDPPAPALCYGATTVSYRALADQVTALAGVLQAQGVGPEVRVGLCVERAPELAVGILGILKAGGAYVPLDPAYPPERLARMLETAEVAVLLTQDHLRPALPAGNWAITTFEAAAAAASATLRPAGTPANLAYVIFTSGSTGQPKGIALRHQGVVNNLADLNRRYRVEPADRVLALSSLSFDMCVYEVLGILAAGGTIVLPDPGAGRDPAHWATLIARHGITIWNSAPALLELLVSYAETHPAVSLRSLRLALLGGDWVPVTLPDRLKALAPGIEVIVMGGATEASIHSIIYPVGARDPAWNSIPYGVPMANQTAVILDTALQPVPVGVPGELHLGGIGLARGYFGRPDLTAERFIPHPTAPEPGARLYKTGDLARYGADGVIELLGRLDFQVKIRGLRIELGEIVAALRRHPAVAEAVVVAREATPGDKRLVAYVTGTQAAGSAAEDPTALSTDLRAFLRETLPDYMVPSAFVRLEALPLSPNGKIDRRALPAPPVPHPAPTGVAPQTPVEEVIAGIWAAVLGMPQVGATDDFFALGGQSLLATQITSRIAETLGVPVALGDLFDAPTVADLAATLTAREAAAGQDLAETAALVLHLSRLSDDEVQQLLAAHEATAPALEAL